MTHIRLHHTLAAAVLAGGTLSAHASCGATFCTLMTDRYAQGSAQVHQRWSADLRVEQVTQKRLRSGTRNLSTSEVSGEEAIERRTKNLNLMATLDYGIDEAWSLSLRLPVVKRDHRHDLIDEETELPATPERWRFTRLGDVQVIARHQTSSADKADSVALFGGLKLPTGSITLRNGDGIRAERSLQPGSGTTDLVLGVAGRHALGMRDALFGQVGISSALNSREDFRPGPRLELSSGWSHAYSARLGAVLQLNLRWRGHDRGAQAEPSDSGSTTLDLSPGLTLATGPASTVYAYVQVPLVQNVRGVQLVPRSAFALGWTGDF